MIQELFNDDGQPGNYIEQYKDNINGRIGDITRKLRRNEMRSAGKAFADLVMFCFQLGRKYEQEEV